ncbi:hypothetical protein BDZ91DRAFT_787895 [Kalaharituber pfeilii]|nr:hypothetical protein BDZ91DRAFT_787895 [Kalaharituber pfeilii]
MPAMVSLGFQAVILCGVGANLYPFTQAENMPKALLPLANRPMIYYALDWCEKAGVHSILILTLQEHLSLIQSHFRSPAFTSTSLSHILSKKSMTIQFEAPSSLNDNLQSADILRIAHSKGWIKGDFVLLPCDIVAQGLGLQQLAQVWMVEQAAFGGGGSIIRNGEDGRDGRRGPLGVWYGVGGEGAVKGQETDLIIISPPSTLGTKSYYNNFSTTVPSPSTPTVHYLYQSLPPHALKGLTNSSDFPLRHSLLTRHPHASLRCNSHRDAHIYIFPHWVLEFIVANPKLSSVKDDVIPWLAKCGWQKGLGEKMGLSEILAKRPRSAGNDDAADDVEEDIDVCGRSTMQVTNLKNVLKFLAAAPSTTPPPGGVRLASRVIKSARNESHDTTGTSTPTPPHSMTASLQSLPPVLPNPVPLIKKIPKITAFLAPEEYVPTSQPPIPYIRRVDSPQLFLSTNLHLAKSEVALPGQPATSTNTNANESVGLVESQAAVQPKIDPTCNISPKTTITTSDCLLGPNCTVQEKCIIKRCVLGQNVTVNKGARLMGCVLLEGCVIEDNVKMDGCIVGKNARIGQGSVLKECEVGHGYIVEEGTEAKGERLVVLEGIEGGDGSGWGSEDEDGDYDSESDEEQGSAGEDDEREEEAGSEEEQQVTPKSSKETSSSTSAASVASPTAAAATIPLPVSLSPTAAVTKRESKQEASTEGVVSRIVNVPTGTVVERIVVPEEGREKEKSTGGDAGEDLSVERQSEMEMVVRE